MKGTIKGELLGIQKVLFHYFLSQHPYEYHTIFLMGYLDMYLVINRDVLILLLFLFGVNYMDMVKRGYCLNFV